MIYSIPTVFTLYPSTFGAKLQLNMADPLSISASIIAVIQLSGTVIEYLNGVKAASEDRQRLLNEVTSISGFLYFLKDRAEQSQQGNSWSSTLKSLNGPKGPLEQFKIALERLTSKLAPVVGLRKAGKAITWPFQKEEIKELLATIERQKSLFSLALQNDHMCVLVLFISRASILILDSGLSQAIKDDVGTLHDKTDKIVEGVAKLQINQLSTLSGPRRESICLV
jgi:hypothetical protein